MFPTAEVQVLEVSSSDHLPLLLQLNTRIYVPKAKRFQFENIWIRDTECLNLVKNIWDSRKTKHIMEKIEYVYLKLDEWGGGKVKELTSKIKNCRWVM